jgi:Rod binding domain-containing protein
VSDPVGAIGSLRPTAPEAPPRNELREAARQFEAFLVGQLLRTGSEPIAGKTPLDGGSAGRMYRELFLEEVARLAASRGDFGLADEIERQWSASSGAGSGPKQEE